MTNKEVSTLSAVIATLVVAGIVLGIVSCAHAATYRCDGYWTGNSCIGSSSQVDGDESYEGETYYREDRR